MARKQPSKQKATKFVWDERKAKAAQLFAEKVKRDEEIAATVGVNRVALWKWRQKPEFQARVAQIVEETAAALKTSGIRVKENRLRNLQRRIDKMHALIDARAFEMAETQEIAGGETGLLVRDYKGSAPNFQAVYKFDAALVKELREHEKQAAIELGEWTEKQEQSGEVVMRVVYGSDGSETGS